VERHRIEACRARDRYSVKLQMLADILHRQNLGLHRLEDRAVIAPVHVIFKERWVLEIFSPRKQMGRLS